jgi:DNA-binding protein YbaB
MFDKLKQIAQMKGLQDAIHKEIVEVEKEGVKVSLRGDFSVEQIILNPDLSKDRQEQVLKDCLNDAVKKIQLLAVQKFSGLMN